MKIVLTRKVLNQTCTMGELTVNGAFVGYTLEDVVRAEGAKVHGKTAIPKGTYRVIVSMSNRFKKRMPEVLNVPMFSGVRIHGGNTHENTEGCPLLGLKTDWKGKIWDCAEVNANLIKMIDAALAKGEKVELEVK